MTRCKRKEMMTQLQRFQYATILAVSMVSSENEDDTQCPAEESTGSPGHATSSHNRGSRPLHLRPFEIARGPPKSLQPNFAIILDNFRMSEEELRQMIDTVGNAIDINARKRNSDGQPLWWCYVPTLPTGRVSGWCLALDFGCSSHYIRVSLYNVTENSDDHLEPMDHRAFLLTPTIRKSDMSQFCDFVTMCMKQMLLDNKIQCLRGRTPIYMGVAAGFDVRVKAQRNPASATVQFSSKDYLMPGFIGHDFVPQFHAAFERADLDIQIGTVINDTVGILLAGIHKVSLKSDASTDCSIGVLCHREGSNMAYLETDRDFLELCDTGERQKLRRPRGNGFCAIVNTEAGYWIGANGELDDLANTIEQHVRERLKSPFRLECIISGAWYPHILRRTIHIMQLTKTIDISISLEDNKWPLDKSQSFEIFAICDQWRSNRGVTIAELASRLQSLFAVKKLSTTDAKAIAGICHAIVGRTAEVTAAGVMAIAQRIYGRAFPAKIAIAFGGSLFMSVSQLESLLTQALNSMMPSGTEISLVKSDVSFGCAITAISSGLKTDD